jgi:hypothetical protein
LENSQEEFSAVKVVDVKLGAPLCLHYYARVFNSKRIAGMGTRNSQIVILKRAIGELFRI